MLHHIIIARYLVNALASGNLDNLKEGCEDSLHQPARGAAVYKASKRGGRAVGVVERVGVEEW